MTEQQRIRPIRPNELDDDEFTAEFVVSQGFDTALGMSTVATSISFRRPRRDEWFRASGQSSVPMFQLRIGARATEQESCYLVTPKVAREIPELAAPVHLVHCVNREGASFFWGVRVPDPERPNTWTASAVGCLAVARQRWVRLVTRQDLGCFEARTTAEDLGEAIFPEEAPLLNLLLRARGIKDPEHEVIRKIKYGK